MTYSSLIKSACCLLATTAISTAATSYTATVASLDGAPEDDIAFFANGSPIPVNTGSIAIGYFDDGFDPQSATSPSQLISSFNFFSNDNQPYQFSFLNGFDSPGFFDGSNTATIDSTGINADFIGKPVTVLIGEGSTLATSTLFAALSSTTSQFADNNQLNSGSSSIFSDTSSNLLLGIDDGATTVEGFPADSVRLVAVIPEPSSTGILVAVALAGITYRRRA